MSEFRSPQVNMKSKKLHSIFSHFVHHLIVYLSAGLEKCYYIATTVYIKYGADCYYHSIYCVHSKIFLDRGSMQNCRRYKT